MHRVYMGSQVIPVLLGWHESVGTLPELCKLDPTCRLLPVADIQRLQCRQPILADEVQSFKALITVHKVLQEGHPIAVREAQANTNWLDSLTRGVSGEGLRGMRHSLHGNGDMDTQEKQ